MTLGSFKGKFYIVQRYHFHNLQTDYRVIAKIGEGSFSEVMKVEDVRNGVLYAAKKLKKVFKSEKEMLSSSEINAIKRLEYHPNIVGMVDIICDKFPGNIILIFELMDMSMYDYIKNRKRCLSESKVKCFLFQIICGLHHLHCNGLFHRDIKPENILIKIHKRKENFSHPEVVQIGDLGSVCSIYKDPPHTSYISTRWYRAPECLLTSGYYGSKMDIWALGCVFYEMLTLNPLFPGDNELDQLFKIHEILGSPSPQMLAKFKHLNIKCSFPKKSSTGFYYLSPILSDKGIDVLTKTLRYHPDMRIDAYRLLNHPYFSDLRPLRRIFTEFSSTPSLIPSTFNKSSSKSINPKTKNSDVNANGCIDQVWRLKSSTTKSLDTCLASRCSSKCSILKEKERAWGMNPGAAKTALITKISNSRKRCREII